MIKYGDNDIPEISYGTGDEPVSVGLLEPRILYDPEGDAKDIKDTIDISNRAEIPLAAVRSNLEVARQADQKQQKVKQYPYIAMGMGGPSMTYEQAKAITIPFHPVRTLAEIGKAVPRFLEQQVLGTFGGTLWDWFGQFIEQGGIAVDKLSKWGAKNPDQIYNPMAQAIMTAGRGIAAEGRKGRQYWLEQGATGWEAIDEKLRETDPVSYGAGRLTEGVASSALSVLAVYLSGGAAAPATIAEKGIAINRGLALLSAMSAAGGFEHAQAMGENFTWSTLHGLTDGMIEYTMESTFLEGVGKGSSALTAGFKEGGEEFVTGMLQNTRAGILENEKKGMSAYEGAKDAVLKALKQSPWEVAAGFIGGWGMVGGANLINLTKKANAMPIIPVEEKGKVQAPVISEAAKEAVRKLPVAEAAAAHPELSKLNIGQLLEESQKPIGIAEQAPGVPVEPRIEEIRPEAPPAETGPEAEGKTEEELVSQIPQGIRFVHNEKAPEGKQWVAYTVKTREEFSDTYASTNIGAMEKFVQNHPELVRPVPPAAKEALEKRKETSIITPMAEEKGVGREPQPPTPQRPGETTPSAQIAVHKLKPFIDGKIPHEHGLLTDSRTGEIISEVTYGTGEGINVRKVSDEWAVDFESPTVNTARTKYRSEHPDIGKNTAEYHYHPVSGGPSLEDVMRWIWRGIAGYETEYGVVDNEYVYTIRFPEEGSEKWNYLSTTWGIKNKIEAYIRKQFSAYQAKPGEYYGARLHFALSKAAEKYGFTYSRTPISSFEFPAGPVGPGVSIAQAEKPSPVPPEKAEVKAGEVPSGGVSFATAIRTGLANAEAIAPKVHRQQRKTLKQKVGAMMGVKESLLKKGVSAQEAIWRSSGQLRGPQAEYEQRYVALDDVVESWVIEAALDDIATNPNLGPFDPINLTNPEGKGAFDKFRRGAYLTKGEVELLKKWNNLIGEEAEKRIPWTVKFFSFLEELMAVWKAPAGYDVQIRRQAGWIRGRHPKLYTEAVANDLAAYVSQERADALAEQTEDDPRHQDAIDHGVRFLDREDPNIEQYLGEKIVAKIPKVGQVYKAAMRGFIDSFNWLQQQLWNQKIEAWEWKGRKVTDEMKNDLAIFNNTILGMAKPASNFEAMARRVLAPVMWSPTMTISRIKTPGMVLTNPTMRAEVVLTLSGYIASGLLIMAAASLVARWRDDEDMVEWDWLSVDFGKIRIGDTRFDVYVDGGPYIRALIQFAYGEKKNQAGRLRPRDRMEAIKQLVRNKRAPIFDFIGQIWTGRTYYGAEAWKIPDWEKQKEEAGVVKRGMIAAAEKLTESDLGETAFLTGKEIYERFAPFFVQAQLEAMWHDGVIVGLMAGVDEFLSGQVMSYEPSIYAQAQILQDTVAVDTHKKLWEELSPKQQDGLRRKYPQITELEIQADAEMVPPDEISLAEQNRAAEKITKALPKEIQKELSAISLRISAPSRNLGAFRLNDARYEAYQAYMQAEIEKQLQRLFANKTWPNIDKTQKTIHAKARIDNAKADARERLKKEIAQGKL